MIKNIFFGLAVLVFLGLFVGTLVFLRQKAQAPPVEYATQPPETADIVLKTVATGSVLPRQEVEIKPQISGIVDELYVEPGDAVASGDRIARIRVVPNTVSLNDSESRLRRAEIGLENARLDLERNRRLVDDGTISQSAYQQFQLAFDQAEEEQAAARDNLEIVRKGSSTRTGATTNTIVRATIDGMVLEVPVEIGNSVIESNTFNDGTTIATVADMDEMVFEGKVDESEVGKLDTGMRLVLTVGALERESFGATLEHIAPKGVEDEGAIQFEIRAALEDRGAEAPLLRANYSANADIVLDQREGVLAIEESLLQFDDADRAFVEVETAPQRFERRDVELGLSDGLRVEVVSGLGPDDQIKDPRPDVASS
ncbi:MAG: efflux RND transporter periplasmic adaptor subunit [Acidobacteriota bacterium]